MTIVLIGGTSHTGKSTLAATLGARLGLSVVSTDSLGRHPGRPWPVARPQVAEFYRNLTAGTIYWFLKVHHENLRPRIDSLIAGGSGLILEGSALRPEYMAGWPASARLFLHADPGFLIDRIRTESHYAEQNAPQRALIDIFTARSLSDNAEGLASARAHSIQMVDAADRVEIEKAIEDISNR